MMNCLNSFLDQQSVVLSTTPSPTEIVETASLRFKKNKKLSVMYGETYDKLGPTLDSLKYYFVVAGIAKLLQSKDGSATPTILIADIATCRNEPSDRHAEIMDIGRQHKEYVQALDEHYGLGLNVLLMSEYLFTASFQSRLKQIRSEAERLPEVFEYVKQTVPASKVEIEQSKGFTYAFEEIATIIEYDIKVGPPREKFYDEPTRMIAEILHFDPLMSVYLHPTYPLGFGFDFFFANEEIEKYGVTAYKAGSKGLSDHRMILGQTSAERMATLIDESFVGKKREIPNPVLELAIIAEMARQWLAGELEPIVLKESFYEGKISTKELKDKALTMARQYILEPVNSILNGVRR